MKWFKRLLKPLLAVLLLIRYKGSEASFSR